MADLARLDAMNNKVDRRKGHHNYDEAYLERVRTAEQRMEKERRREKRRSHKDMDDREQSVDRHHPPGERPPERQRIRDSHEDEARAQHEADRVRRLHASRSQEERTPTRIIRDDAAYTDSEDTLLKAAIPTPWKLSKKYERLDEKHGSTPTKSKKNSRVISGPYVEDGRTEEVYRRKGRRGGGHDDPDGSRRKTRKWICKAITQSWLSITNILKALGFPLFWSF